MKVEFPIKVELLLQLIACDIHVRHEKKSQKDEISCCDW